VAGKLARHWSPAQISRWLRRRYRRRVCWHVCTETIYEAVYRGLIVPADRKNLRTGRTYRHRRGRGRTRDGALKQSTAMKSIQHRPASVESRRQAGHWEGDLIVGAAQRSAIATLVERKTRFTLLVGLSGGHCAQSVGDALIGAFGRLPSTHPFHPLCGQRLDVLYVKRRAWDSVFVCSGGISGQITLLRSWTDRAEPPGAHRLSAEESPPPR
jgi:IS30 family transposase